MTYLNHLTTSRNNLATELVRVTAEAELKPNYSIDGRSISWNDYRVSLSRQMKELDQMIINAGGAVEFRTIALG